MTRCLAPGAAMDARLDAAFRRMLAEVRAIGDPDLMGPFFSIVNCAGWLESAPPWRGCPWCGGTSFEEHDPHTMWVGMRCPCGADFRSYGPLGVEVVRAPPPEVTL